MYHISAVNRKLGAILPAGSYHYVYDNENASVIDVAAHTKKCKQQKTALIFSRISKLEPKFNALHKLLIDNLLCELLILISSEFQKKQAVNRHILRITEYIRASYKDEITRSSLSKKFNLSETYIARLLKMNLNIKPSNYINSVKIERSKYLLIHTDLSITEISDSVGYSSVYYFSRVFKNVTVISPRDFRDVKTKQ